MRTMFLRPVLGAHMRSKLYSSLKNTRSLRPSIKIGKETFQLCVDVRHFNKSEIRVKAHPEFVVIEGKHEKETQQGYILRQFIRKFKLPEGCVPSKIQCRLDSDGILTITAPRSFKDSSTPAEMVVVPISYGRSECGKIQEFEPPPLPMPKPKVYVNPCKNYPKVKPKK